MQLRRLIGMGALLAGFATSVALAAGPDVIVGDIPDMTSWGSLGGIRSYTIATTSCNIGTADLKWISNTNDHPVIAQNLFRVHNGRIEQIGQSWLKHGFFALTEDLCDTCNGHGGTVLGVGCSDPYDSWLNGQQDGLGPRSEVNASTGVFTYPFILGWNQTGNATYKRIQVAQTDLGVSGARYFVEGHYVTKDDAAAGNKHNNASYRRVTFSGSFSPTLQGTTQREKPAIHAWVDHGLGVNQPDPDVTLVNVDIPGDGRFIVGYKVTNLGGGDYHYEYAIQNLNSHESGGSFSIPYPDDSVTIDEMTVGFRGVAYHSGEPYSNTNWNESVAGGAVTWSSPETFATNPNSNALRWGTLYNFSFDAPAPPTMGTATLGLFRSGGSASVAVAVPADPCPDLDGDGNVTIADVSILLASYGTPSGATREQGDLDGDGDVDIEDLSTILAVFGTSC